MTAVILMQRRHSKWAAKKFFTSRLIGLSYVPRLSITYTVKSSCRVLNRGQKFYAYY